MVKQKGSYKKSGVYKRRRNTKRRNTKTKRRSTKRKNSTKRRTTKTKRRSTKPKHFHRYHNIKFKSSYKGRGQSHRDAVYNEFMNYFEDKLKKMGYPENKITIIARREFQRRYPSMSKYSS